MDVGLGKRRIISLVVTCSVLSAVGCSLLYDLSPDQCETNADCSALGGDFIGRICSAGVCTVTVNVGGSGSGGEGGTGDNTYTVHSECLGRSGKYAPKVCIEKSCVELLTADCPLVLPQTDDLWFENLRTQAPIIVGAYAFVPNELVGIQTRNYDLALSEVTRKTNGVLTVNGQRRQVVAVVCRANFRETTDLDDSAKHLIEELQTPGIVSALLANDLQHVFEKFGEPRDTFFMSPLESDSTLVTLQDRNLLWQLLPGGEHVALPYPALLDRAVAYIGTPAPTKVAVVTASDVRFLSDMNATVLKSIRFNGKSATTNATEHNFLGLTITSTYTDPDADLSSAIKSLRDFAPHVIIALSADETLRTLIPLLESSWLAATRPFYLLSPYHYNNPELAGLWAIQPSVRARTAGINFASSVDTTLLENYQLAFDQAYPEVAGTRGYENFYDAMYFLLYSLAAARQTNVTGTDPSSFVSSRFDLASGMLRLLNGEPYDIGKDDLSSAFSALNRSSDATITLNGTLGPPDFDRETGGRISPGSVWCVDDGLEQRVDVLRFDEGTQTLVGSFPCFTGF